MRRTVPWMRQQYCTPTSVLAGGIIMAIHSTLRGTVDSTESRTRIYDQYRTPVNMTTVLT